MNEDNPKRFRFELKNNTVGGSLLGGWLILVLAAFLSSLSGSEIKAPKYRAIFLGTLGGGQTIAAAINNVDQVVGYAQLFSGEGPDHAFLYTHGTIRDLDPNDPYSNATSINNYGEITGLFAETSDNYAFVYQRGVFSKLRAMSGYSNTIATGVNDAGTIVGSYNNSEGVTLRLFTRIMK